MKHPVKKIISHLLMFALVLCVAIAPGLAERLNANAETVTPDNGAGRFCTENLSTEE